jgi:cell wall-associated NlpC family hydrolase
MSGPVGATPAPPPVDAVSSALTQLRTIAQQNEQLGEQLNQMSADVVAKQQALALARTNANTAAANYADQRAQLTATLTAQYEAGSTFSRTGALLNSSSGGAYTDKLNTLDLMSQQRANVLATIGAIKATATKAQTAADDLLAQVTKQQTDLQNQQGVLAVDEKKYEAVLLTLTAAQRSSYQSYGEVSQNISQYLLHTGPAAVQTAVNFALAQVGKPYVFGAAGPSSYDCSGLTMQAYAAVGIALPHYATAQYGYGTHVAETDLQPGDLVFMYRPISHVTIYIGYGLLVSAPEPGDHVKVITLASQQDIYAGATRLVPSS